MKKIFLILIFALLFQNAESQSYWSLISTPTTSLLKVCHFTDSLTGWAAGDSATIIKTVNGGYNWTRQPCPIQENIHSLFFLNKRLGWALSWNVTNPNRYGTIILKTTNGGTNWDSTFFPVNDLFYNLIMFQDSLTGWLGGFPDNIRKTTDGGHSWDLCGIDSSNVMGFPIRSFAFYNKQYGFGGGGFYDLAGVMFRTTNSGLNWSSEVVSPEPVNDMFIFDSLTVIGVGGDIEYGSGIVKTTNGGANWKYQNLGLFGIAYSVSFRNRLEGWSPQGFVSRFIYTLEGGEIWDTVSTPNFTNIYDVQFVDSTHGFAVGGYGETGIGGVILKYNPQLIGINGSDPVSVPDKNYLFQNFPNPFNPSTTIKYSLVNNCYVNLKVYDLLGKEIRTLQDGFQRKGDHQLKFAADNLPSGVYFYKLFTRELISGNSQEKTEFRKMVVVK